MRKNPRGFMGSNNRRGSTNQKGQAWTRDSRNGKGNKINIPGMKPRGNSIRPIKKDEKRIFKLNPNNPLKQPKGVTANKGILKGSTSKNNPLKNSMFGNKVKKPHTTSSVVRKVENKPNNKVSKPTGATVPRGVLKGGKQVTQTTKIPQKMKVSGETKKGITRFSNGQYVSHPKKSSSKPHNVERTIPKKVKAAGESKSQSRFERFVRKDVSRQQLTDRTKKSLTNSVKSNKKQIEALKSNQPNFTTRQKVFHALTLNRFNKFRKPEYRRQQIKLLEQKNKSAALQSKNIELIAKKKENKSNYDKALLTRVTNKEFEARAKYKASTKNPNISAEERKLAKKEYQTALKQISQEKMKINTDYANEKAKLKNEHKISNQELKISQMKETLTKLENKHKNTGQAEAIAIRKTIIAKETKKLTELYSAQSKQEKLAPFETKRILNNHNLNSIQKEHASRAASLEKRYNEYISKASGADKVKLQRKFEALNKDLDTLYQGRIKKMEQENKVLDRQIVVLKEAQHIKDSTSHYTGRNNVIRAELEEIKAKTNTSKAYKSTDKQYQQDLIARKQQLENELKVNERRISELSDYQSDFAMSLSEDDTEMMKVIHNVRPIENSEQPKQQRQSRAIQAKQRAEYERKMEMYDELSNKEKISLLDEREQQIKQYEKNRMAQIRKYEQNNTPVPEGLRTNPYKSELQTIGQEKYQMYSQQLNEVMANPNSTQEELDIVLNNVEKYSAYQSEQPRNESIPLKNEAPPKAPNTSSEVVPLEDASPNVSTSAAADDLFDEVAESIR